MVDIKAFPYLCFVRFDLVNKEFDRQFNIHFDDHIQELADKPGYSTAWRTRELRDGCYNDNEGVMEQEYQQIYAISDPGLFKSFPQNPPPPVMEKEPWRRDLGNWGRVFYRVLSLIEKDARPGRCWARCESNFHGTAAQDTQFQSESAQHIKRVLELPGIHRAWQLQHAPHPAQIGPDPVGNYMNMYEADAPENLFDPSLGEYRIPLKAGQKFAGRHFARLLLKAEPR
jgi:hypothetical protein